MRAIANMGLSAGMILFLALSSCGDAGSDGDGDVDSDADGDGDSPDWYEAELGLCADAVNAYREETGLASLDRSSALESCAAEGAEEDAMADDPNSHFLRTDGCGGVAMASVAGYAPMGHTGPRDVGGAVETLIRNMTEAGPGDTSHDTIVGPYEDIGCGVFVTPESVVWLVIDFD